MFDKDTVAGWRGHELVDRDGGKIGKIGDVYLDSSNDRPEWVTVKTGLFGRRETFVPISEAASEGEMVRVPFEKEHVKDAPGVDPDAQLSPEEEAELYRHYGLDPGPSQSSGSASDSEGDRDPERRATDGHDAEGRAPESQGAEGQGAEGSGTPPSGGEGQTAQRAEADRGEPTESHEATDRREPEDRPSEPKGHSHEDDPGADEHGPTGGTGAASAREDLGSGAKVHQVGEEEAAGGEEGGAVHGRLRLKKYVVKEEVRIPVEREETRIERE